MKFQLLHWMIGNPVTLVMHILQLLYNYSPSCHKFDKNDIMELWWQNTNLSYFVIKGFFTLLNLFLILLFPGMVQNCYS